MACRAWSASTIRVKGSAYLPWWQVMLHNSCVTFPTKPAGSEIKVCKNVDVCKFYFFDVSEVRLIRIHTAELLGSLLSASRMQVD